MSDNDVFIKTRDGLVVSTLSEDRNHFIDVVSKAVKDLAPKLNLNNETPYRFSCAIKKEQNFHSLWDIFLIPIEEEK